MTDLTNRLYYFELTTSPNRIWADLKKIDFQLGAPVMVLHPDNLDLNVDVTKRFKPAPRPF